MREINFDITNVETAIDGNKIYIVVDWVGDESKVDNLFIDLLDSEHELIDDCIYPKRYLSRLRKYYKLFYTFVEYEGKN
jgi:hypothetical protein